MTTRQVVDMIRERAKAMEKFPYANGCLLWCADLVEKELLHSIVLENDSFYEEGIFNEE